MRKRKIWEKKLEETFMKKILGTYVKKEGSSKLHPVCFECQKKFQKNTHLPKKLLRFG